MWKKLVLTLIMTVLFATATAQAQELPTHTVSLTDPAWQLAGDAVVGEHLGRQALQMRIGSAARPDLSFEDGTIEFDMAATTPHRAFVLCQVSYSVRGRGRGDLLSDSQVRASRRDPIYAGLQGR